MAGFVLPKGAFLMPMAGVTDAVMRLLCYEMGAGFAVSEMLSAKGWIYSNGENANAKDLIRRLPGEGAGALQIFGRDPELMAEAARRLEGVGFEAIDINFGCPMPKITGNGEGSALMKEPAQMGRIVSAVARSVSIPVTCKMRSGWDAEHINAPECARICEDAGAGAVTVHARTRDQLYAGKADPEVIRRVRLAVSIPVIANGDVASAAQAQEMTRATGCAAVGVGRAARGDPWIFREILAAQEGREFQRPTDAERMDTAIRHFDMAADFYGKRRGMLEMRKHLAWYTAGMRDAARLRSGINRTNEPEEVRRMICAFRASGGAECP